MTQVESYKFATFFVQGDRQHCQFHVSQPSFTGQCAPRCGPYTMFFSRIFEKAN